MRDIVMDLLMRRSIYAGSPPNADVRPSQETRIPWVDLAKGIGIFLVVVGHVFLGLTHAGILEETASVGVIIAFIYSFHMPLFFFLAGLFLATKVTLTTKSFLLDKLGTLAYPYLVWSVLQWLMQWMAGEYTNTSYDLKDIWQIVYQPVMQFWFLYALFLILMIYLALSKVGLSRWTIFGILLAWRLAGPLLPSFDWYPLLRAQQNAHYVALAAALYYEPRLRRLLERPSTGFGALIAVIGYAAVGLMAISGDQNHALFQVVIALCGIIASVALATFMVSLGTFGAVAEWGRLSLEIYLAHTIASAGLRIFISRALEVNDPIVHIIVGTMVGLWLPILAARMARRFGVYFVFRLKFPRGGVTAHPVRTPRHHRALGW